MKNTLKRLLSLMLVLSMVISVVPAAFATEVQSRKEAASVEEVAEETEAVVPETEAVTEATEAVTEATEEAAEETEAATEATVETTEATEAAEETTEATEAVTEPSEEATEPTEELVEDLLTEEALEAAAATGPNMTAAGMKIISLTTNNVAPGVTYDKVITRNNANQQNVGIMTTVDLNEDVILKASYKNYYTAGSTAEQRAAASKNLKWGFQEPTVQAAAYETIADPAGTVVMATNGDYFNLGTGEPTGYLIIEGNVIKAKNEPYFAILKDGTAVIRDAGVDHSDVVEAVSGPFYLVKDGKSVAPADPAYMPRNSVGIRDDGSVVFFLNDGRQAPTSVGMTLPEVAAVLLDAGCHTALYLDGGGSASVSARKEGASKLQVVNSPSDGHERTVSSSFLVISTAESTGVFDHASITPNDELYTPNSQVQFAATGVDSAGTPVEIPADVTWALADDCADMGTIDANGLFTANDKTGIVTVEMRQNGKCVGSAFVEIVHPDAIYFENDEVSLGFEEVTDFKIVVRYMDRDVNYKVGDLVWTTTNEKMGTFDGNIFTASDGESLNGEITATSAYGEVSGTIKVIVGMLPTIVWTFEDVVNEDGSITDASDYYIAENGGILTTGNYNRGGKQSIEIVSIDDGEPVRFGEKSMKLNFDFTQCGAVTEGAIIGTAESFTIPGTPTALGVWVYAPEGVGVTYEGDGTQAGFWLRGYISDANGGAVPYDFTFEPKAVLENGQWNGTQPGIYWEGWKYCEADLTHLQAPYTVLKGNTFRLMYVAGTNMGTKTANSIYFDNFQFVYGTNVDDVDEPKVDSISVANKELTEGSVLTENKITLRTTFSDVQNKYTSGVDANTVRMYIDGVNVVDNDNYNFALNANDGYAELYDLELLDGQHSVTVSLRDNFGNDTSVTRFFTVNTGSAAPAVTVAPAEDAAVLSDKVTLEVRASGAIANIENTIRLSNRFPAPVVTFSEAYTGTYSYNKTNYTLSISAQLKETAVAAAEDSVLIATIEVEVPADLTENDTFIYEIKSGSYTDADGKFFTYSEGEQTKPVEAAIAITCDPILVGGADGVLTVTDQDGKPVANASIFKVEGDELIGTTDENGQLKTNLFNGAAATVAVYAKNEAGKPSFHFNVMSYDGGTAADAAPSKIQFNAVSDITTQKALSWLSNPLTEGAQAIRYRAEGTEEWTTKEAKTTMLTFTTGTNKASNINSVTLTGLIPGTTYEYQVGTGELWSEIGTLTTSAAYKDSTKFFVMADIQAADQTNVEKLISTIKGDGYDFGIQTGDAIDSVTNYAEVENVVDLLGKEMLNDMNMVRVLGNHEYYGDPDGNLVSALFDIDDTRAGTGYSVTYGDVYVATIHFTNTAAELDAAMEWLKKDAAASNATWKVLTLHQPPYYTNAVGGNGPINAKVPAVCEEVGIDVVFSGHDHSLARTNPLTAGEVDEENGILYYIGGSSGEKSYPVSSQNIFDYEKIFALATVDFNATYIGVEANKLNMTLNVYDVMPDGTKALVDTYTLYTETGACDKAGHQLENAVYDRATGKVICNNCGMTLNAVDNGYTDWARDKETGRKMYLIAGEPQVGEFLFGEEIYFFDDKGVAIGGEFDYFGVKLICENGLLVGGEGFVKKDDGKTYYYQNGKILSGWHKINGEWHHFNKVSAAATTGINVEPDEIAKARSARFDFDENGKLLHGYFNPAGYYYWGDTLRLCDAWVKPGSDPDNWYRTNGDGHFVTDTTDKETVRIAIDGVVYTFDNSNGKLLKGDIDVNDDGTLSYYWAGEPVNDGWFELNGLKYYAKEDGTLATGTQVIEGKAYMFTAHGILVEEGTIMTAVLNEDETSMKVTIKNTEKVYSMRMAIWSAVGGQKDTLRWYDVEQDKKTGEWTLEVPMCVFNRAGKYIIHAYGMVDGKEVLVSDTTTVAKTVCDHVYASDHAEICQRCNEKGRDLEFPSVPQFRMYDPNSGEHFYTGSTEERDGLVKEGWQYEGVAFNFPEQGDPVYRLYDPITGEHLYTMDDAEIEKLKAEGWNVEGVSFNSAQTDEVPQYRMHNPNATRGAYHFTGSEQEKQDLLDAGWEYQGIGWYSCLK